MMEAAALHTLPAIGNGSRMEWSSQKHPRVTARVRQTTRHLRRLKELLGRNEGDDPRRATATAVNMLA